MTGENNDKITVTLPDGSKREYPKGVTAEQVAADIGKRLAKDAVAARVDGNKFDLFRPIEKDVSLAIVTRQQEEGQELLRHSAAHVMAQALQRLYGEVKLWVGPPLMEGAYGFYYDVDMEKRLTPEELPKIEEEMRKIAKEDLKPERIEMPAEEAKKWMREKNQPYKVELIDSFGEPTVSFYKQGEFVDLCRGPHLPTTAQIGAVRLMNITGAYLKGDPSQKMLQRIYGAAFYTQDELEKHLSHLEEVKKRDHRRIGQDLELFSVHEEVGGGLVHWHPRGGIVRHQIERLWWQEHLKRGYQPVYTPHIASEKLYEISGHLANFAENMYSSMEIDERPFRVRPMNCPGHIMIYKSSLRSYRELPLRLAELGTVYRYEKSGVLQGMLRVRGFTIDDAHIFCTPEQVKEEVLGALDLSIDFLKRFGFENLQIDLSTRPEKAVGSDADWEMATASLKEALEGRGIEYHLDEGGGAFYGPKISIVVKDSLGHEWQCSTVQFDFNLPERFDLEFVNREGDRVRPVMVHRAVLGSLERFFGALVEHYAGNFPVWLAPTQVRVLTITDEQIPFGNEVLGKLRGAGLRVDADLGPDKIGAKIRNASLLKIPYMAVIGGREADSNAVAVREHSGKDLGPQPVDAFLEKLVQESIPPGGTRPLLF